MACVVTAQEYAERMGISVKTVRDRCSRGFYEGAFKEGRRWYIPIKQDQQQAEDIAEMAFQILMDKMQRLFERR